MRHLPIAIIYLSALNGLSTEGIFRIPADFDEVTSAKTRYDQWEPAGCSDAHVPAALLKQWLRELYIPLIPGNQEPGSLRALVIIVSPSDDSFYNEAVLVGEDPEQARSLVSRLPELHRTVLSFLIRSAASLSSSLSAASLSSLLSLASLSSLLSVASL